MEGVAAKQLQVSVLCQSIVCIKEIYNYITNINPLTSQCSLSALQPIENTTPECALNILSSTSKRTEQAQTRENRLNGLLCCFAGFIRFFLVPKRKWSL